MKRSNKPFVKNPRPTKNFFILLFIVGCIPINTLGQSDLYSLNFKKDHFIQMKSPNVSIMERFDTFKVNYFNGLPDISIPLFEIQTRGFSIPINLQYHSSGIKVSDVASWVGLGWNLTGQCQISRTVKGGPDESSFLNPNYNFLTSNDVIPSTLLGYKKLASLMPTEISTNLFPIDSEPDIFHYNFLDKNGSFRYLKNAVPITIPFVPLDIKSGYQSQSNFNGFKITDEKGIKYTFGKSNDGSVNYFERTKSVEGGRTGEYTSVWLATEIVDSANKDSIQYEYYPKRDVNLFSGYGVSITVLDQYNRGISNSTPSPSEITTYPDRSSNSEQHLLKNIFFENGKVEYILSSNDRRDLRIQSLSALKIYKKKFDSYEIVKTITFYQSYFQTVDDIGRLKLDSIKVTERTGKIQVYKFEYDESMKLPKNSSLAMDYWGYFNNATSNTTGIPDTTITYSGTTGLRIGDQGKGRNPDSVAVQIGILKKIIYPTGGFTEYEYEPNRISQHNQILIGGGVRIKRIKSYSNSNSLPLVRTFKYGQKEGQETGYGYVNANTQFNFLPYTMLGEYYDWSGGDLNSKIGYTYRIRTFSNIMSYDRNDYDNSNVVYPFVTEYIGNDVNNIGKNTYLFTYQGDQLQPDFMRVRPVSVSSHWLRGKLNNKKSYRAQAGQYHLIEEEEIGYGAVNNTTYSGAGLLVGSVVSKTGNATEEHSYNTFTYPYHSTFYNLTSGAFLPIYKSTIKYSGNTPTVQQSYYEYDKYSNIIKTIEITSSSDTIYTHNKYISDYSPAYGGNNFINSLKNANILNRPIEQYLEMKKAGEVKSFVTSGFLHVYNDDATLKENYKLETANKLIDFSESSFSTNGLNFDSRYRKDLEFVSYDRNKRPREIRKIDGKTVSYEWGNFPLLPTVEVFNAKNAVEVTHFGTASTQLTMSATASSWKEFTFTVGYTGDAKLVLYPGSFLASSYTMYVNYELSGPINRSGSLCMSNNPNNGCYSGLEAPRTANFIGLTPGIYKIRATCGTTVANSSLSLGFDYPTEITYTTNGKEFFYEGFENKKENLNTNSYAGRGCYLGDYVVNFSPVTANDYLIDYRYLLAGKWNFVAKKYTDGMILADGDAIDEVRVYPINSHMKSYTYDEIFGITSKTDVSGETEFYEYDGFGRLKYIMNQDKEIIKMFEYNYRN